MLDGLRRLLPLLLVLFALPLARAAAAAIPHLDHILVIVMENHSDASLIGNPDLPYLNRLAKTYGYDDDYYGVTHPSLPNYVAMITGSVWGSHSDDPAQRFPHASLVEELERAGLSWKAYMQSLPRPGYPGAFWPDDPRTALYVEKHDPFMLLPAVRKNAKLSAQVVPLGQLARDLATGSLPDFSYIVPDVCHDMHGQPGTGPCSRNATLMRAGDRFLQAWIPKIMDSAVWKQGDNFVFITWDEADHRTPYLAGGPDAPVLQAGARLYPQGGVYGGGRLPLIAVGSRETAPVRCHEWADHYSLLKTIEQSWHLPYLGRASDDRQVHALSCFWSRAGG